MCVCFLSGLVLGMKTKIWVKTWVNKSVALQLLALQLSVLFGNCPVLCALCPRSNDILEVLKIGSWMQTQTLVEGRDILLEKTESSAVPLPSTTEIWQIDSGT